MNQTLMERIVAAVDADDFASAEALVELGNYLEACYFWTEDDDEEVFIEGEGI